MSESTYQDVLERIAAQLSVIAQANVMNLTIQADGLDLKGDARKNVELVLHRLLTISKHHSSVGEPRTETTSEPTSEST